MVGLMSSLIFNDEFKQKLPFILLFKWHLLSFSESINFKQYKDPTFSLIEVSVSTQLTKKSQTINLGFVSNFSRFQNFKLSTEKRSAVVPTYVHMYIMVPWCL